MMLPTSLRFSSAMKAHQFFTAESWDSFKQIFDTYMFEASKVFLKILFYDLYFCLARGMLVSMFFIKTVESHMQLPLFSFQRYTIFFGWVWGMDLELHSLFEKLKNCKFLHDLKACDPNEMSLWCMLMGFKN